MSRPSESARKRSLGTVSSIDVGNEDSWANSVFLTIDIDWAHDEVIHDTADLLDQYKARATWFVTHETPALRRLENNPSFELGIHPNFNWLLEGKGTNGKNAEEVVERLLSVVPDAKAVRSHSLVQGTPIMSIFADCHITHACNNFVPAAANIELKPWKAWTGLAEVPHLWADDECLSVGHLLPIDELIARRGLIVFDFHPIHVFLNSEANERYAGARPHLQDMAALNEHRNIAGSGSRDRLIQLLEVCS